MSHCSDNHSLKIIITPNCPPFASVPPSKALLSQSPPTQSLQTARLSYTLRGLYVLCVRQRGIRLRHDVFSEILHTFHQFSLSRHPRADRAVSAVTPAGGKTAGEAAAGRGSQTLQYHPRAPHRRRRRRPRGTAVTRAGSRWEAAGRHRPRRPAAGSSWCRRSATCSRLGRTSRSSSGRWCRRSRRPHIVVRLPQLNPPDGQKRG